ncbi:hypothetical protein BOTCAL_0002g00760 [Botryotinia calthae]|uniref:Uncharacterized protein n=1 Tax=Botryotinia calthae TaxID=38488 RepID=A0A4Y8DI28_9HELO|nr:hypothetical protein BOTCAL_0002g00760 [Botryotinia calthae]
MKGSLWQLEPLGSHGTEDIETAERKFRFAVFFGIDEHLPENSASHLYLRNPSFSSMGYAFNLKELASAQSGGLCFYNAVSKRAGEKPLDWPQHTRKEFNAEKNDAKGSRKST